MLIQFTIENFRSFREAQTFSMVAASRLKRLKQSNTFAPPNKDLKVPDLLKCAAIFGANASGKSNFVKALRFVESMVLSSSSADPKGKISVQPFRLNSSSAKQDSRFEIEFIEQDIRFQFGFTVNTQRITSEWLLAYYTSRSTELYNRQFNEQEGQETYTFGRSLEGGRLRKDWAGQTGPKTLYLSRVVQASSDEYKQLKIPFEWFARRLRVEPRVERANLEASFSTQYCENEARKLQVIDFLKRFDIPVSDILIEEKSMVPEEVLSIFNEEFKDRLSELYGVDETLKLREPRFLHEDHEGNRIEFSLSDESDGTINLFAFAAKWLEVSKNDYVLVVDELDSSLHPLAVWELVRKLSEDNSRAQLIFTTHDITILRSKLLRRDQVYFVSTNLNRASSLYSLQDFKGREEDAFEDRYLQGRYGATPVIGRA
jgi:AAA15 family ATPase/GTPase